MGSFFFGLFAGLFIIEGMAKNKEKTFEEQLAKTMRKSSKRQYFLHFLGLAIVIVTYSMVALFFNVGPLDNPTSSSYWYLVLTPLAFLVGLTVFLIPCFWEGNTKLTRLINKVLGWKKWVHLDKISINFYALAPMLIGFITYSMQSSIYYDYLTIFTYLLGDLFLVYLLSVVCTAAF